MNKNIWIMIVLITLLQACGAQKAQFTGEPFEKLETLDGTGFIKENLDTLTDFISGNLKTTGMMILKDGEVLYEYGDTKNTGYLASCRKSILSILYGKYVENGTIDLNETIGEIGIDEDGGLLEIEKAATVDQIINARSGVFYQPVNGGYDENNVLERGSVEPGEYFLYNNWDFNVAGYILEKKTGKSVYELLEEQLAIPLGFQDWNIKNQKKKHKKSKSRYPAYHMYLSARDIAKIGQLMLNKGKWNGKQIVSEAWIEKTTTAVTPTETVNKRYGRTASSPYQFSYGYMWWIIDNFKHHPDFEGAYHASGWGGQFITILPKINMVITHKYKVPTLVDWGFMKGGVASFDYWELVHKIVSMRS